MLFILIIAVTLSCLPGISSTQALVVRLSGITKRDGEISGLLDVRYRGKWGHICYYTFHSSDARVACRQLGYLDGSYQRYPTVGQKEGLFRYISCSYTMSRLDECYISEGTHQCLLASLIALRCRVNTALEGMFNATLLGSTGHTGILEVTSEDGKKAAVCFGSPLNDTSIGKTTCGQMGYSDIFTALVTNQDSYKGNRFVSVFCNGTQPTLASCSMTVMTNCPSTKILGLACKLNMTRQQGFDLRLSPIDSSPSNGTVEVYTYGNWGVICDTGWDMKAAQVVCRQLGFRYAANATKDALFGQGTALVFWINVQCSGDEQSLAECKHDVAFEKGVCHSVNASGVVCSKERLPSINICSNRHYTLATGVTFIRSPNYPGSFKYTIGAACYVDLTSPSNFTIYTHNKMFRNTEFLSFITNTVTDTFYGDDTAQKVMTYNTNRMTIKFQANIWTGDMKLNIRVTVPQPDPVTTPVSVSVPATTPTTPATVATVTPRALGESRGTASGAIGGVVGSLIIIAIVVILGISLWKKGFIHFGKWNEEYKIESDAAPTQDEATTEEPTDIYEDLPNSQATVNKEPIYVNSAFLRDSLSETAADNSSNPGPVVFTYEDLRRNEISDDSTARAEAVQEDTDVNSDIVGESPYAKLDDVNSSVYLDLRQLSAEKF
ncbi:deleted in malignant brain tumors 1 protein-like [Lineus longissimus]|uniref:deleted in malignant brain tumors 1 protein-like n=1 Tax=Lineus longissimus TaxID=88925 RepID=UPI00315C9A82